MIFTQALEIINNGGKVVNPKGTIIYKQDTKIYGIPKNQYPKGKREEVKIFWDAILSDRWSIFTE